MLRVLLGLLLLANLLFWAWTQTAAPGRSGAEPQRMASQVRPEWVQVLPAQAAKASPAARCMEAGPFADADLPAAEAALRMAGVAEGEWQVLVDGQGQRWLRLDSADATRQASLEAIEGIEVSGGFRPCRVP